MHAKMKLTSKFRELRKSNEHALMPYIPVGYPDIKSTEAVIDTLIKSGSDIIELGLPFSDPIADGSTIQKASESALDSGINTDMYFRICKKVCREKNTAFVAMTYYNLIFKYGLKRFTKRCADVGISGIIVPDLPVEESHDLKKFCREYNIDLIYIISPTTTDERIEQIIKNASGFIYLVSLLGVTGARDIMSKHVKGLIRKVKSKTNMPVCLGFGISQPKHVKKAIDYGADGVIVGSAIIDTIEKNRKNKKKMLKELSRFVDSLKDATSYRFICISSVV